MSILSFVALSDWFLLAVVLASLLYIRATQYRAYWKSQNLVHEKLSLFFGPQLKHLFKPFHIVDQELYKKHGRLFGSFEDGKPVLYVAQPDLIKLVLVKDASKSQRKVVRSEDPLLDNLLPNVEPEKWRKIRSATSPAFTTSKLRKMQAIIDSCAALLSKRLKGVARESQDIDLKGFFGQYTFNSVAKCSFGANLPPNSPEEKSMIEGAKCALFVKITPFIVLKALLVKLCQAFHERFFNPEAFNFYKHATLNIIQKREKNKIKNEDFLQIMLNAKEASIHSEPSRHSVLSPEEESSPLKPENVKNLTEDEALAQCVLFFLAGQDATSSTLSLVTYMLALNPGVQDKLHAEVDECFRKHGNTPSYDEISKLPYLDCVVSEALRLMPTATRLERAPTEDYVLGDTGIKVPRDCSIVIPIYAMHNDPDFFPEPDVFNPDRFSKENVGSIGPYTYLPFGAGPRNCIGMRFAMQILKTGLLHAVHSTQFVRCPRTKVTPEFQAGFGLLQAKELFVGIRERNNCMEDSSSIPPHPKLTEEH
ncbi:cytochrome P450 3A24-like [Amblyomma americanum]